MAIKSKAKEHVTIQKVHVMHVTGNKITDQTWLNHLLCQLLIQTLKTSKSSKVEALWPNRSINKQDLHICSRSTKFRNTREMNFLWSYYKPQIIHSPTTDLVVRYIILEEKKKRLRIRKIKGMESNWKTWHIIHQRFHKHLKIETLMRRRVVPKQREAAWNKERILQWWEKSERVELKKVETDNIGEEK